MPISPSVANANGYNPGVFMPGLGFRVTKTEDISAAGDDLFVVSGLVGITALIGRITNAIGNTVTDYVMSSADIAENIINSVDISAGTGATLVNMLLAVIGNGSISQGIGAKFTRMYDMHANVLFCIGSTGGSLTISTTHTAGDAGDAIVWTLFYLPLEAGASVTAAA